MAIKKTFPTLCPSCNSEMMVTTLHCQQCDTTVSGLYDIPVLLKLKADQQQFVLQFIKCSGSIKQMAADMGLSYPTVRNILDEIIENINQLESYE